MKLTILIIGLLVIFSAMGIVITDYQNNKTIADYLDRENKLEEELEQSIQNFTELEEMYLELKEENIELKEQSDIIWDNFEVTAYTKYDDGCNNITAIGVNLDKSWTKYFHLAAVDPDYIELGKTIFIKLDGKIIEALAVDTGGKIKGHKIDLYFSSLEEAFDFGVKEDVPVGVIND